MFNSAAAFQDDYNTISQFEPKDKVKYDEFSGRPINYSQNLWKVHDGIYNIPEERFVTDKSPLIEAIIETTSGPMEEAPIPKGLVDFVMNFVNNFNIVPTKYSAVEDVLQSVMTFLDYTEPYFLFADMPVQVEGFNLTNTYRFRDGRVLDPAKLECFKVRTDWKFQPYQNAIKFLEHPSAKAVLAGEFVAKPKTGERVTKHDLLENLIALLWGPPKHMEAHIDDWLYQFYENVSWQANEDDETLMSMDAFMQHDDLFWFAAATAAFMWIRSPHALPFLIEYHPIYSSVLNRSGSGEITIAKKSGGEAFVYNYDVFTMEHLIVEEGKLPGTCENCRQTTHCTKFVNATALFHPICSCGEPVDVEATGESAYRHNFSSRCDTYRKAHPTFEVFVCQRCLQTAIKDPHNHQRKCERFSCPATSCQHHAGKGAYIQHLSNQRKLMLTQMQH